MEGASREPEVIAIILIGDDGVTRGKFLSPPRKKSEMRYGGQESKARIY